MRVHVNNGSGVPVLVMSGASCPRLIVENKKTVLRDDYRGDLKMARKFVKMISTL